jgi:hypothetical protein
MQTLTLTFVIIGAISVLAVVIMIYWQKKNSAPVNSQIIDVFIDINDYIDKVIDGDAKIVSIHPRESTGVSPDETVVKLRLAVKENENSYKSYLVRWKMKKETLSALRQGQMISVKLHGDYIFPVFEGAALVAPTQH